MGVIGMTRYTKTAPKKEGYYWIRLDALEDCDEQIGWFIPLDDDYCHVASPHDDGLLTWEQLRSEGATRSIKEVKP
jgi:hypothetical protein